MREQIKQTLDKIRILLAPYWLRFQGTKFYQNKKVFLPVSISLGVIFLMILIGLIFGRKKPVDVIKSTPRPTPALTEIQNPPPVGTDTLSQIEQKLTNIKSQINNLDVKQSRLQPPALDFKVKF